MRCRNALPCVLVAVLSTPAIALAAGAPTWELAGGHTELLLNRHVLGDLGIELSVAPVEGGGKFHTETFRVADDFPTLRLSQPGGSLEGHVHGGLSHLGQLTLSWNGAHLRLSRFELVPAAGEGLFDVVTDGGFRPFFLDNAHAQFIPETGEYVFLNMDLRMSPEMAARFDRPELAGRAVGAAHVRTVRVAADEGVVRGTCAADFSGVVDVALTELTSLTEVAHDSPRVAMAPSAKLANVGVADVPWFQAIAPDSPLGQHPFLYIRMFRMADGILEQIAESDLKHAFFSINSDCICQPDQILYDGCGDTYGVFTNTSRYYLAPRDELTAATGDWTSLGSHFDHQDGMADDDVRSHGGDDDHPDDFEHLMTAMESDLSTPGARYFYSAWYLVKDDEDIDNNMGYREVTPTLSGGWSFPHVAGNVLENGPTLDAWVDPSAPPAGAASTLVDECVDVTTGDCDGHLKVAAKTTLAPNGLYRYDYAVQNLDYDPQIDSFSIPLPAGVEVTNVGFGDIDDDPGNDWVATVTPSAITWDLPGGASSALDWGTLYNFRFEANADSTDVTAGLGIFETRGASGLTATSKGPDKSTFAIVDLGVALGGDGSGEVTSAPVGIDCGSDCDEIYVEDLAVTLTAAADPDSKFMEWTEGGLGVGSDPVLNVTLDMDRSFVAEFELCDKTLGSETVNGAETFEACQILRTGPSFVVEASGAATLRAGAELILGNGVSVEAGGSLVGEIDASLLP